MIGVFGGIFASVGDEGTVAGDHDEVKLRLVEGLVAGPPAKVDEF